MSGNTMSGNKVSGNKVSGNRKSGNRKSGNRKSVSEHHQVELDLFAQPLCEQSDVAGQLVCGVDEVGRGPLCGPVVTAAVILDPARPIEGLNDSKKLSEKKRDALFDEIREKALAWCIARADVEEIDELNILHATMLAMQRAVAGLSVKPDLALIDGNRCPSLPCRAEAVIKGDGKVPEIGAASILAKVARDREMAEMEKQYPGYGIGGHKGYPTKVHLEALKKLGVTPIHRRSFKPVRDAMENTPTLA